MKNAEKKKVAFIISRTIGRVTFQGAIDSVKTHMCLAIKDTINNLGLTQKEAASLAKCSVKTISNAVHGRVEKFSMEKLLLMFDKIDPKAEISFEMTFL